ncbi:hypothetical protein [Nonomuraea jiangxiensis]|uniref:Uncharacterized protein n=1 Tax=Nonomuraea jiangxiensis TaxID=633440 RepID=A0A1G9W928_9ACTN|nr:hypothetical protein [Nonomuraea jiangxiensis]SDM81010.1 hypothetical protein SAMN05421869_15711 [Nonomuraea jiangxiensis]
MTETPPEALTSDPAAPQIAQSLAEIRVKGRGLFSRALVMVNGDLSFDEEHSYRTPIAGARSGGTTRYSLAESKDDGRGYQGRVDKAQARMSKQDSEVAVLQETWDWIEALHSSFPDGAHIRVVVVGNIGPCTGCKARLELFRQDLIGLFGAGRVIVESVYDTKQMFMTKNYEEKYEDYETGTTSTVSTTYGYEFATVETYQPPNAPQSVSYWLYQVG